MATQRELDLAEALQYALDYIDGIPKDIEVDALGFDRDWADGLADVRKEGLTSDPINLAWTQVNALGGTVAKDDLHGEGYVAAVDAALEQIEACGGQDDGLNLSGYFHKHPTNQDEAQTGRIMVLSVGHIMFSVCFPAYKGNGEDKARYRLWSLSGPVSRETIAAAGAEAEKTLAGWGQ